MKLVIAKPSPFARKVRVALRENGLVCGLALAALLLLGFSKLSLSRYGRLIAGRLQT